MNESNIKKVLIDNYSLGIIEKGKKGEPLVEMLCDITPQQQLQLRSSTGNA